MKKALLIAPVAKFHTLFNINNIFVLQKMGYKVSVCANFENDKNERERNLVVRQKLEELDVDIINAPFVRKSLFRNLQTIKTLRKLIRSNEFEIIHVHTETGGFLFWLASLFLKKRSKYVYTPHGTSFYKGSSFLSWLIYKPIETIIAKKMDVNISMNDEEKYFFDKCSSNSSEYVHGIGVDIKRIQGVKKYTKKDLDNLFGIGHKSFLIVSVGELCKRKNHIVVLKALSKIRHLDIRYIICGTGKLEKTLKRQAIKLQICDKVTFAGYREDVLSIVSACDLFVFPSIYEGLPVSIMEAMALEKPIVCSCIRGNRELISEGNGGYLIKNNNPNDYAHAILHMINKDNCRMNFGMFNASTVKSFSDYNVKEELKCIYSKKLVK